jgi:hypothetical protein
LSRLGEYLRRHHLALVAIFLALTGSAIAAFDPVGSDGDIDACFSKKSKQLSLAKHSKCAKGTKAVSWSQTGPAGSTGPQGEAGTPGTPGTPGTARAYGLVQSSGLLTSSKGATVTAHAGGVFCVSVPGVTPGDTPILLTTDYSSGDVQNGVATVSMGIGPNPSSYSVAAWDPVNDTCPAGEFEVQTGLQHIDSGADEITVFSNKSEGFSFIVP